MGVAMIVALAIGIAFGWTLERAGLGSAPKLAGQFYFTDFTVLKVMFTAIVVAMLGAFWLGRLGVLDLAGVYVPETFLLPQIAGGAIFGAGFLIAGLCPGTSCVAAASGRGDGLAVMGGMFTGVLATGLSFAFLQRFYESTPRGALTIPQWLHVPYGLVVGAVVFFFAIAPHPAFGHPLPALRGEGQRGTPPPQRDGAFVTPLPARGERVREAGVRGMLALAAIVTMFAGSPYITRYVEPLDLASWIKDHQTIQVIDGRSAQEFAIAHVPGSTNAPGDSAIHVRKDGRDYVLRGGIDGWKREVLAATRPTPVTRYFGGLRRHGC